MTSRWQLVCKSLKNLQNHENLAIDIGALFAKTFNVARKYHVDWVDSRRRTIASKVGRTSFRRHETTVHAWLFESC